MNLNEIKELFETAQKELDKAVKIIDSINNKNISNDDIKPYIEYVQNYVKNAGKITTWLNNALQ